MTLAAAAGMANAHRRGTGAGGHRRVPVGDDAEGAFPQTGTASRLVDDEVIGSSRSWDMARRMLAPLVALLVVLGLVSGVAVGYSMSSATPAAPIRVMPLGDSLTYGYPTVGGYRIRLAQLTAEAGMSVDFVGTLQHGPPELADKDHEGHGGLRIDELTPQVAAWVDAGQPDIVLLHVGTNDVAQEYQMEQAPSRLQALVEIVCQRRPGVRLVVASIGARDNPWTVLTDYNAGIQGVVATVRKGGCNAQFLDMNKVMRMADLPDDAHPNETGYRKMADSWFPVLRKTYDELRQEAGA